MSLFGATPNARQLLDGGLLSPHGRNSTLASRRRAWMAKRDKFTDILARKFEAHSYGCGGTKASACLAAYWAVLLYNGVSAREAFDDTGKALGIPADLITEAMREAEIRVWPTTGARDAFLALSEGLPFRGTGPYRKWTRRPGGPPPGLLFEVMRILLQQSVGSLMGYVSTKELETVCLGLCLACREHPAATLCVSGPEHLTGMNLLVPQASRVDEAFSPVSIKWRANDQQQLDNLLGEKTRGVTTLSFERPFNLGIDGIRFGQCPRLRVLTLNPPFNQPIDNVDFGNTIESISLLGPFNQPIERVRWPRSLKKLRFGWCFNQLLTGLDWPPLLASVAVGARFTQRLDGVVWPPALHSFTLGGGGGDWNHSLDLVSWPPLLRVIRFPKSFNCPISGTVLPAAATEIRFPMIAQVTTFNHSISRVVWPKTLRVLVLGNAFSGSLAGVKWPGTLVELRLGGGFSGMVESTVWPGNLETIALVCEFNGRVEGATWPPRLKCLEFGSNFNQPVGALRLPATVEDLSFGDDFNQSLAGLAWPASLQTLAFGHGFRQNVSSQMLPANLVSLSLNGVGLRTFCWRHDWPPRLKRVRFMDGELVPLV